MSVHPPVLELAETVRAELQAWAAASSPREACGLLLGTESEGWTRVAVARNLVNTERQRPRERYKLDPAEHLAATIAAEAEGLDVVGVWHSHPNGTPEPSEMDRAAAWPRWSYVIVATGRGDGDRLRSFRLIDAQFVEERLVP